MVEKLKDCVLNDDCWFKYKDHAFGLYDLQSVQGSEDFYVCAVYCASKDPACDGMIYLHVVPNACSYGSDYDVRPDEAVEPFIITAIDQWLASGDANGHVPATLAQVEHFFENN